MFGEYPNIAIRGIASTVPVENVENLDCISKELTEKKIRKQIRLTGIERRRILTGGQTASDLATKAADELLNRLNWNRDTIKIIVYVTQAPDIEIPSTALLIQTRLGIGMDCLAFDVNLGCSGYVAGIQIVAGLIHEMGGRALLLAADGRSRSQRQNAADYLLFGNAGTATAIEAADYHSLKYQHAADGRRWRTIYRKLGSPTVMDGNAVFAFTINDVADSIQNTMEHFSLQVRDIDYFVFHQGQKMIIDNLAEICGIPLDKMLYSLKDFGNTSCASIPLSICNEVHRLSLKKVCMYLCGFGVGLSWGSIVMSLNTDMILPVMESSVHYTD